jgi:hypothetical protein
MKEFLTFLGARLIGFPTLLLLPLPEILNANFLSIVTLYIRIVFKYYIIGHFVNS